MKKQFRIGDRVKIPSRSSADFCTDSSRELSKELSEYSLDYLIIAHDFKDGEFGVERGDDVNLKNNLFHERDLEHYEIHSDLIKDAAFKYTESLNFSHNSLDTKRFAKLLDESFIQGIKWYQQFINEQSNK